MRWIDSRAASHGGEQLDAIARPHAQFRAECVTRHDFARVENHEMPDVAEHADPRQARRGADGRVESQEVREAQWRTFRCAHGLIEMPAHRAEGVARRLKVAMNWARRLKRVFKIEIESCRRCGGKLAIIASIEEPLLIAKILSHRKSTAPEQYPTELPLGARAPPMQSRLL